MAVTVPSVFVEKSLFPKVVRMVVTVVREAASISKLIQIAIHWMILPINKSLRRPMVIRVPGKKCLELKEKI